MTLVIGHVSQERVNIIGDTKLSDELTHAPIPITKGLIKTKIISPLLTVSFAGDSHAASQAIRGISPLWSLERVAEHLLAAQRARHAEQTPEFLIGSTDPEPALVTVKDGTSTRGLHGWVGSYHAFRAYRALQVGETKPDPAVIGHSEMGSNPAISVGDMKAIMQQIISDPKIPEVGGFAVGISSRSNGFQYMGYAEVYFPEMRLGPGRHTLPFGTAEQGSYAYDLFGTADQRGVTSYFLQGRFGFLYWPDDGGFPTLKVIKDVDPFEFMDRAAELSGTEISTSYADIRILVRRANDHWARGDFKRALDDIARANNLSPKDAGLWKKVAAAHERLGHHDKAYAAAVESLKLAPDKELQALVADYEAKNG